MMTCHRSLALATAVCAAVSVGCKRSDEAKTSGSQPQSPAVIDASVANAKPVAPLGQKTGVFVVGKPAPELLLPGIDDGKPMSLARLRGKKTLLLVFASW